MSKILIIGCLSFDTLHLEQHGPRQTHSTIGGAALFTALAASACGAEVTLYAPKPKSLNEDLAKLTKKINWIGPLVDLEFMPRLEIIHHGDDRATLIAASWGAEVLLTSDDLYQSLGADLTDAGVFPFDLVYVAALSTAARQRQFILDLKAISHSQPKSYCKFSAGTYARAINADAKTVRALINDCDYFFMNSNEARLLSADLPKTLRAGQMCIVTDGGAGADLFIGPLTNIHVDAVPLKSEAVDPTGAGDTFCGAMLATLEASSCNNHDGLVQLASEGARHGAILASQIIGSAGSSHYLELH